MAYFYVEAIINYGNLKSGRVNRQASLSIPNLW